MKIEKNEADCKSLFQNRNVKVFGFPAIGWWFSECCAGRWFGNLLVSQRKIAQLQNTLRCPGVTSKNMFAVISVMSYKRTPAKHTNIKKKAFGPRDDTEKAKTKTPGRQEKHWCQGCFVLGFGRACDNEYFIGFGYFRMILGIWGVFFDILPVQNQENKTMVRASVPMPAIRDAPKSETHNFKKTPLPLQPREIWHYIIFKYIYIYIHLSISYTYIYIHIIYIYIS